MRRTLSALMISTLVLAGCGAVRDSRVNPFNWFGNSRSEPVQTRESTNPLIPSVRRGIFANQRARDAIYRGQPFQQVTDLTVERVPGGAIIRATGLAERQGIYDVQLTPATDDETPIDGVLIYRLEGVTPANATRVGTAPTREVIAARKVTDQTLAGVSQIRVEGQLNAQVARR
jgi:hypothetical protein